MNKVALVGRLTKDPEVKNTQNNAAYANFTVAVDRRFKDANGNKQTDFINCLAWRQSATFLGKYFRKGNKIAVIGSIQTRSYDDQNGQKVYVTEVLAEELDFVESANSGTNKPAENVPTGPVGAELPAVPDNVTDDVELPFEV